MPGVVEEAVTSLVARLLVLDPEVERLAFQCPLLLAVVTGDDAVVAAGGSAIHGEERRPVRGAGSVADALAAAGGVLVEGVEGHAVGAGEHAVACHGRGGRTGVVGGTRRQGGRCEQRERQISDLHDVLRWGWGSYPCMNVDTPVLIPRAEK